MSVSGGWVRTAMGMEDRGGFAGARKSGLDCDLRMVRRDVCCRSARGSPRELMGARGNRIAVIARLVLL